MGKFSKIFHHIESKDLRNKHEQKKAAKIQEEKKKEDTRKYIASAMEQVKYNWRSDIDLGAALREGMTTSDVATISVPPKEGDGIVSTVDAIDATSYVTQVTNLFGDGVNRDGNVGSVIRNSGSGSGQDGGFNVGGQYLSFQGDGYNDTGHAMRWAGLAPIDSTEVDTLEINAIVGNDSNGGEDPDAAGEELYVMYQTPAMSRPQFTIITPDGQFAPGKTGNSTDDIIIPLGASNNSGLNKYSVEIPDYARAEGTQFILIQVVSSGTGFDNYGITNINFQRKTPVNVVVPLDNPQASSFIRGADEGSSPKKRKKAVDDKLEASDEYTTAKFGNEFPGQEVRVGGEDPFKGAKIGDDVEPSPQNRDEVLKKFSRFSDQAASSTTYVRGAPTAESEPEPTSPSAQATMAPTTDDGDPINVKTVGGKNSGVVQGADAANVDAQEPETTEPEIPEPEIPEPEPLKSEPPDETKTPEEVEEIENEKLNAKANESANVIDNLIDFRLDQGLKSFNAIAQATGAVINTAINIGAFAANVLGMKEANGFVSMIGKIQNSIDIARSVLSGKITNANVLPQEIKSFTDSMKVDEFQAKKIFISDVRHEYADDNIYVKDGKIYQNGDGKDKKGLYATPLANQGFETLDTHGSGYAQMIIPKDGSEPYLHYYDHNYHNLNEASDVSFTGGIGQSLDDIWSNLFGPEDLVLPNGQVIKGMGKANPVDIVAAGFQSISYLIHQLKSGNTKFLPTRLKDSMLTYFGSFDQVYEGLLNTSIEGFPPGIHGSALTDFKVPLSKLPQETQDMIASHPLSWTPERIENMTPEQINEQLYPLLETEEQFQNYLDFSSDITKMSTEPVNTVPFAVAMEEMDKVYEIYENELLEKYGEDGWEEFSSGLNREKSEFFAAERAANEDLKTLESEERKELDENNRLRGAQAESDLWDKLVGPYFKALQKITSSGGSYDKNNPTYKKMVKGHTKWKKEVKEMQKEASRIQSEIMDKYKDLREPIENIAYEQLNTLREPVKDSPTGQARWKIVNRDGDESSGADYTALDGTVYKGQNTYYDEYYNGQEQFYNQIDALYDPVADLQKYVDGAFIKEGIGERFESDFGFSSENWSPAKSGDGKPRGDSGKPKSDPDPRFAYAGTGADAASFTIDPIVPLGAQSGDKLAGIGGVVGGITAVAAFLGMAADAARTWWKNASPEQRQKIKDLINNRQNAHYVPTGDTLLEKYARPQPRRGLFEKVKSKGFFNPKDIKPIFPENPPPKLDPKTGMHPQYGKKAGRYKKLDPISANSMPTTGDPEIDAVVNKQKTINKIKKMARNK